MTAARIANLAQGARTYLTAIALMSRPAAATLLNVGRRSVQHATTVLRDEVVELAEAVDRGRVAVSAAARIKLSAMN